jgi:glyoxylase-like metal-dependent hydrolase (beta-lactamase superfamily II)
LRIERVLANNPGPFTGPGTNTWLLGDGADAVAIIDPGPLDPRHAEAIASRVGSRNVESVLVTHTHIDHAPMANPLAKEFGVPALGYGSGPHFEPDVVVGESDQARIGDLTITVIHTPGHADDHLCFRVGNVLFTGDHIMGGSSVMVETMGPYLRSLEKLRHTGLERLYPGHGEEMDEPDQVIDWYLAHRMQRHAQVLEAIRGGATSTEGIVETVYADVDRSLHVLAAQSVKGHLGLLVEEGLITWDGGEIAISDP